MKLHEVELFSKDTEASRRFYGELLGLELGIDIEGLKVFHTGWPGLDLNFSVHRPGQVTVTFLVENLESAIQTLEAKGVRFTGPSEAHLGMHAVTLEDPDGNCVQLQSPSAASPDWLKGML